LKSKEEKIDWIIYFLSKKENNYSTELIDSVHKLLKRNNNEYSNVMKHIISIGIPSEASKIITEKIFSYEDEDVKIITDYLLWNKNITIDNLKSNSNLTELFLKTKINSNFIKWINNFTYYSGSIIGTGEIIIALLIKGASKNSKWGDVSINNKEIEIKGTKGRIYGRTGYSHGIEASKIFYHALKTRLTEGSKNNIPKPGSHFYGLGKRSIKYNIFNDLAPYLLNNGLIELNEIIDIYKKAIKSVFHNIDVSWIYKYINKEGQIDNINDFLNDWLKASIKYYFDVEKFDNLIILNRDGKYVFLEKQTDPIKKIKIASVPSFTAKASIQGATFAVNIK
jgi:hypothetical protein